MMTRAPRAMRLRDLAFEVAAACALALALLPLVTRLPNALIADDGYFYAQIAYHLGVDGHSTFDGIHTTSGYHLPWALVLAGVSRVLSAFTLEKTYHLYAHLAVSLAIALATARHFFRAPIFQLSAFVLLVLQFSLTEMVFAAPFMLGLLRSAARDEPGPAEAWLACALPLIRIDLSCMTVVMAIVLLRSAPRRAAGLALATAIGMVLQLGAMKLAFGHFVSVAATIKAGGAFHDLPGNVRFNVLGSGFQASLFGLHLVMAGLVLAAGRDRRSWLLVLAPLSFLALHTVLSLLRGWYWVPSFVGLLFALEQTPAVGRLLQARRATAAIVTTAFAIHGIRAQLVYAGDQRAAKSFLAQLGAWVPQGSAIYTYDNPGYLGFFSGFDIVDGDGLVNDAAYARRLGDGSLAGYLDEERICYVVSPDADAKPVLEVAGLVLHDADVTPLLLVRRELASQSDFALFRLRAPRCRP